MAAQQTCQMLQGAPQLHSFIIPNARPTGRQLGGGSYGTVEELEIDGLVCAGKKLHDTLIHSENQGAQRMAEKYYNECSLLSDLRHPHIVQFLGISFLPDSRLPLLVMERLQGSLDELLENTADIPLSTKVSILQDVARGLVYLHNRSPSVIHRDLSARNILLNSAMTAKIADLGNSRIADIQPGQLAQTMTRGIPGTLVYMPPEALSSNPRYGPPLDMFSFGHLTLFTAIQVFPRDLLTPTYHDPHTNQLKARSELERRGKYIDVLHETFDKKHPLALLIKGCLEYEPVKRPTARQALETLGEMRATVRDPYSDLNRLQLEKSLTEKEAEVQQIPQLRSELEQLTTKQAEVEAAYIAEHSELGLKEREVQQIPLLRAELDQLRAAKSGLEEVCSGKDEMLVAKELEIAAKERALSDERQRVSSLTDECATLKGRLEGKTEEIESLQAQVRTLQNEMASWDVILTARDEELQAKDHIISAKESEISEKNEGLMSLLQRCSILRTQLERAQWRSQFLEAGQSASGDLLAVKDAHIAALQTELRGKDRILQAKAKVPQLPSILTFNLSLKWKKSIKMSAGVSNAQVVVIGGTIYIGGGEAKGDKNIVFGYTIQRGQWREIETPVQYFGMAVVNDQLIITGGQGVCGLTNMVWVLDSVSSTWLQPFPAMPTARYWPSAVGYKRWVLVVGGNGKRCVEVLDTTYKQWYTATPLPANAIRPSLTVIEDTLYVMQGYSAVSISIPMLISDAVFQTPASDTSNSLTPTEWQPLPDTPTESPTITALNESLVAMGGDPVSSTIAVYLPQAEQWLKVAKLPTPCCHCACIFLPETKEMMVIGGMDGKKKLINSIDLYTL